MANSALFSEGSSTFEPSLAIGNTRYVSKPESVTGLDITLGANERLVMDFMTSHTDSFLEVLTGIDTSIQLSKGSRPDAGIRINPPAGSIRFYECASVYSHGCFNAVEIIAGADPTDISLVVNGTAIASQNIGASPLNISDFGSDNRYIKRLEYINAAGVTTLKYDFLEESGLIASPSIGTGNLTFTSEPKRFAFTLVDGIWIAEPAGYPDPVKISIPEDALKYRVGPVSLPNQIDILWGYGQSLGLNFMNGATNEQRHHETIEGVYQYSGTAPELISKYAANLPKQAVGYPELTHLTQALANNYFYSNTAQSSTTLANLSKGSVPYELQFGVDGVLTKSVPLISSVVDSFTMTFTHGEKDTTETTPLSTYKSEFVQLVNDAKVDSRALTGVANLPFRMVYTQVGKAVDFRDIRQAQYELAIESSEIIFAGPRWPLNAYYRDELDIPPDGVHLSPYGYALLAEMHSQAIVDTNWQPLLAQSAVSDVGAGSQIVLITCTPQTAPLRKYEDVTDTDLGIYYVDSGGNELSVTNATLGSETITVDLGRVAEAGSIIRFGSTSRTNTLPLINIMDSTEWVGVDTGFTHSHVMPIFDIAITTPNIAPTANAGTDQIDIATNKVVTMDFTSSADADGTIVSYSVVEDTATGVAITGANTATPSFTTLATAATYTFTVTVTDDYGETDTASVTYTSVDEVVVSEVYNLLELKAQIYSNPQTATGFSSSVGALFKNRDAKITIEVDNGETDPSEFSQVTFALFPLAGRTAVFTKSTDDDVNVVNNKIEVLIDSTELAAQGRHYFEVVAILGTKAQLLSGYLTVVDSRLP